MMTIDQLVMANSVHWYGHVLRKALESKAECKRKKWRLNTT